MPVLNCAMVELASRRLDIEDLSLRNPARVVGRLCLSSSSPDTPGQNTARCSGSRSRAEVQLLICCKRSGSEDLLGGDSQPYPLLLASNRSLPPRERLSCFPHLKATLNPHYVFIGELKRLPVHSLEVRATPCAFIMPVSECQIAPCRMCVTSWAITCLT